MNKKILHILIFTFVFAFSVRTDAQLSYGLKFRSTPSNIAERTSFQLIEEGDFLFRKHLHLSFDFQLDKYDQFGYICRFVEDEDEICLIYLPYGSEGFGYFDLVLKGKQRIVRLPVEKEKLEKKEWLNLELSFFMNKDSVKITIGGVSKSVSYKFERSYSPKLIFGCYKTSLALPAISIKDVRLKNSNDKVVIHFPFNEFNGTKAVDSNGRYEIEITKPDWLAKQHYYWLKEFEITSNQMAGNCYVHDKSEINLVGTDSIVVYNILKDTLSILKYANTFPLPHNHYDVAFNPIKGQIDAYVFNEAVYGDSGKWFSVLDLTTLKWDEPERVAVAPKHWHHNQLFVDGYRHPVIFGGYGQMRYFDHFETFNADSASWVNVSFTGDSIAPRFLASLSQKVNDKYYLFGGFGSETGEQALGGYNYYDLYEIDTKSRKIKKLWEMTRPENEIVGANTMVYNEGDSSVYVLCYQYHLAHTNLVLNRFSINKPGLKTISDSIPATSLSISSQNHLFYSEEGGKLIAAIREDLANGTSAFKYYSLLFPPISTHLRKADSKFSWLEKYGNKELIPISAVLLILVFFVVRFKTIKRKKGILVAETCKNCWDEEKLKEVLPDRNMLLLFGRFKAFNTKGQNITHLFSPKLLELLYLILLTQLKNNEGITSDQISLALWPEKELKESKNIRSVTFNHLRNAVEDIEGLEIVYEKKLWRIAFNENVFIDVVHCSNYAEQKLPDSNPENIELLKFLTYTSRGNFGRGVSNEPLDNQKFEIDSLAIDVMFKLISNCWTNKFKTEMGLFISSVILKMDTFNERAIQFKLKFLARLGKLDVAEQYYQKYAHKFEKHFNQSPNFSFKDVINSK